MKVIVYPKARGDLLDGFDFYERQAPGQGHRFLQSIFQDLTRLETLAGIHARDFGFQRMLARTYPFGIFYEVEAELVNVFAVVDMRRDPAWIDNHLR